MRVHCPDQYLHLLDKGFSAEDLVALQDEVGWSRKGLMHVSIRHAASMQGTPTVRSLNAIHHINCMHKTRSLWSPEQDVKRKLSETPALAQGLRKCGPSLRKRLARCRSRSDNDRQNLILRNFVWRAMKCACMQESITVTAHTLPNFITLYITVMTSTGA
jgi:hypothetical protein